VQEAIMKEVMSLSDIENRWDSEEIREFLLQKLQDQPE
jgi:hypothetical protein